VDVAANGHQARIHAPVRVGNVSVLMRKTSQPSARVLRAKRRKP